MNRWAIFGRPLTRTNETNERYFGAKPMDTMERKTLPLGFESADDSGPGDIPECVFADPARRNV